MKLIPILLLLTGCAGSEALQWRPPKPVIKDRTICDQWECTQVTREEFNRVLRDIERQLERGF